MKALAIFIGLSLFTMYALTDSSEATEHSVAPVERLLIELEHDGVESYRFELFEANGSRVYDSGLVTGAATFDLDPELRSRVENLRFEVRAWNESGELVFSQLSALGGEEIFSINFEVIPDGVKLLGTGITLQGDVDVSGGLAVAGAVSTSQLLDDLGGNFFDTCPVGQLARGINSDGSLDCATDQTGGGGGDNLGNHVATTTLTMGSNPIAFNGSSEIYLRSTNNARLGTGPGGNSFYMQGADSTSDAAFFKRNDELITLRISNEGRFKFLNGQKLCTAEGSPPHNTILVGEGWTQAMCNSFVQAMNPGDTWRLGCLFETGTSFGSSNGGPPSPNCGW